MDKMKNNPRIEKSKCKKCGHNRTWDRRGVNGIYRNKCSKCGNIRYL